MIGASPYVTSSVNYKSPFYPALSLSAKYPAIDLTGDFNGNADAMEMGYLARTSYAWFSKSLTEKVCSILYGKPDFAPEFYVCRGCEGFGAFFRVSMVASLVALALSKKNLATCICLYLVATTFLAPLKYIGFARYFLQIWAVPVVAMFNFASCPKARFRRIRFAAPVLPVLAAAFCFLRTLAMYGRTIAIEAARQDEIGRLAKISPVWRTDGIAEDSYTLSRRLHIAGIEYDLDASRAPSDGECPTLSYSRKHMWISIDDAYGAGEAIYNEYPIADSPKALLEFPWRKAYSNFPSPLWSGIPL